MPVDCRRIRPSDSRVELARAVRTEFSRPHEDTVATGAATAHRDIFEVEYLSTVADPESRIIGRSHRGSDEAGAVGRLGEFLGVEERTFLSGIHLAIHMQAYSEPL